MLASMIVMLGPSFAEDAGFTDLGFRFGISTHMEKFDIESYEVFTVYRLPWAWRLFPDWFLSTRITGSAGVITQDDDTGLISSLEPVIALSRTGGRLLLETGGGITILSDNKLGGHDFGGPNLFTVHGGISYRILKNIAVGYQFHHISDGGIFDGKGLNRHLLELSYRF
ncbi:MAG TPA: acyloxyacyl hydrolase [Thermodesulfobacteriota bacterium]|nr:acyloxyacyl hydrolase [Thermodesulfobacteriota bacterium]